MLTLFTTYNTNFIRTYDDRDDENNPFKRVREEVDLRKIWPRKSGDEEFDRFLQVMCVSPDHQDTHRSMLVYPDVARCTACNYQIDAVDCYQSVHPELNKYQAALALLDNPELKLTDVGVKQRAERELDPDVAFQAHTALLKNREMFDRMRGMGFTSESILKFKFGLIHRLTRIDGDTLPDDVEYIEGKSFQRQWRFYIPVFDGKKLVSAIYRKTDNSQLGAKAFTEWGVGPQLFNRNVLDKNPTEVIIASGWGDTAVLDQWGFDSVTSTNGDGTFPSKWDDLICRVKIPYLVTDADEAGEKFYQTMKHRIPWIRRITLDYQIGTKLDVRDFANQGGTREKFLALKRKADLRR